MASSFTRFLDHTRRRATVDGTPLDELSARRRDLYLTTHNNHNRQTSMPPVGFEPTISAGERPQTYALDRRPLCYIRLNKYYACNGMLICLNFVKGAVRPDVPFAVLFRQHISCGMALVLFYFSKCHVNTSTINLQGLKSHPKLMTNYSDFV
jgi:hypothetical protein